MELHFGQRKKEHRLLPTRLIMAGIPTQKLPSCSNLTNNHIILSVSLSLSLSFLLFELSVCGLLFWEDGNKLEIVTEGGS
jgi:hypothetical protein